MTILECDEIETNRGQEQRLLRPIHSCLIYDRSLTMTMTMLGLCSEMEETENRDHRMPYLTKDVHDQMARWEHQENRKENESLNSEKDNGGVALVEMIDRCFISSETLTRMSLKTISIDSDACRQ